jgi:hypothetical protein
MHYVTHRSHQMQKNKFNISCPGAFFVQSVRVPPEHGKKCVDVSRPGCTRMHYMTMNHMFGVTCSDALLLQFVPVPPDHEKIVRRHFTL